MSRKKWNHYITATDDMEHDKDKQWLVTLWKWGTAAIHIQNEVVFIFLNVLKPQTPDKCPLMRKNDGEFYHSSMYSMPWHNQQQCIYIYIYKWNMWAEPATIKVVKPWKWLMKPWNVVQTRYNQRSPEILQIWHSWLVQWTQRYQPTKRREGPLFGDLKTDHPGPRYAPMPMLSWSFLMVLSLPTQYFFCSCSCHYLTVIFPFNSHCIHNKSQKIYLNHHQVTLKSSLNQH